MKAIRIYRTGGPEVLQFEDIPVPTPGPRDALVRIAAIGVNFVEVYHRTGLYKVALPFTPGTEASGVVESVGAEVTEVQPGDRVAYALALGAYAEYAVVPAFKLVPLPPAVSFENG
ncbi:alcohol dehydrogenase catalytic domain-containing protein, partial [candidate division KSB1 bacterium]|nr:alcohol dehydrogenase catalytic domain-containing protein [candidate division KSB1 bacterium]